MITQIYLQTIPKDRPMGKYEVNQRVQVSNTVHENVGGEFIGSLANTGDERDIEYNRQVLYFRENSFPSTLGFVQNQYHRSQKQ